MLVDGTEQWTSVDDFIDLLDKLCGSLIKNKITPIIASTVYIDDRYFKGSDKEYIAYNSRMKEYADKHHYMFINLYHALKEKVCMEGWKKYYNYDHFHPNAEGYMVIAEEIAKVVEELRNNM